MPSRYSATRPFAPSLGSWSRKTVRKNTTIDWTILDNGRARLRVYVKRVLREHGYPPDKQEAATKTVLQQAEALSEEWLREVR